MGGGEGVCDLYKQETSVVAGLDLCSLKRGLGSAVGRASSAYGLEDGPFIPLVLSFLLCKWGTMHPISQDECEDS